MKSFVLMFALFIILIISSISAQENFKGIVKGNIVDAETKQPLPGVTVSVQNTSLGTITDINGTYDLKNLKIGSYSIAFTFIGYEKIVKTDIIVRSERITFVNAEMKPSSIMTDNVVIESGYFSKSDNQPLSAVSFDYEEIRRAPGSAGDVSRIIFGLPSLAKINDTKNSLIVRGGSPVENGFYLDNIEIPNINHFPVQCSSEGPIGILNVDLIDNVNFYSGGFSAGYGNRLSSIMELNFREGNRNESDVQLDMSMQGFGGVIEGPIAGGKGSYVLSARRSYLDLLLNMMNENVGLPVYSDLQGKVTYDLSKNHKLSFLNVFSYDNQKMNQKDAIENKNNVYNDYSYYSNTAGLNWQFLWGSRGYSNTSISHTYGKTDGKFFQSRDAKLLLDNNSIEQEYKFRNTNHLIINENHKFDFGIDVKLIKTNYKQFYNEYQDILGQPTASLNLNKKLSTTTAGGFVNYIWSPSQYFTFTPGVRADYYEFNGDTKISPRVSLTYNINDKTSLTGTVGVYYQNIPWVIAAQQEQHSELKNPRANHYIIGLTHLLTESTKLTVEVYNKDYFDFPVDVTQPNLFLFDQGVVENIFLSHENLVSKGKANSKGVEVTVQKKLAEDFYGLVAGSYYRSKYQGLDTKWYDRAYDNKFNFAVEGGYKPNESWEFSLRWLYAGGAPFTPFNEAASMEAHKGVYDNTKINSSRLPDFHSLNVRADKRWHFSSSTLVTYLSIWNAYGRKNIAAYTWNENSNKVMEEKMWGLLPVFGIEYEF